MDSSSPTTCVLLTSNVPVDNTLDSAAKMDSITTQLQETAKQPSLVDVKIQSVLDDKTDSTLQTTSVSATSDARAESPPHSPARMDNSTMLQHNSASLPLHLDAKTPSARPRPTETTQLTMSAEATSPATTDLRQPPHVPMVDTTTPRHECARHLYPMDAKILNALQEVMATLSLTLTAKDTSLA